MQRARLSVAQLLRLALAFGLVTGIGEVICLGIRKVAFKQVLFFGPHVVWLAPLADVGLFISSAALLLLLARGWPRLATLNFTLYSFSFLLWLSWFLNVPRLQFHASVLLAAGTALQTSRGLAKLAQRAQPTLQLPRHWRSVAVALLVSALGWGLWRAWPITPAQSEAATHQPNVLLIVLDTVRADRLSVYGYARPTTPWLQQFAQRSVIFERAVSTAPWTLPAHASMFTGRWAHELSTDWETPLDQSAPTLAEHLHARGYQTAGFVANTYYCGYEFGLRRGFDTYRDYPPSFTEALVSSALLRTLTHQARLRSWLGNQQVLTRQPAADINAAFLDWQAHQRARPFFAFLNYLDAHEPYHSPVGPRFGATQPSQHWPHGQRLRSAWREQLERLPATEIQAASDAYDGTLAYLDEQLNRLLSELTRRGVLQNTLVIITSDHGETFGEHGHHAHGDNVYWPALHVPLLLSFPTRLPQAQRIAAPISLRDLPATVLDVINLEAAKFPGQSLARYWRGEKLPAEPLFSSVNLAPIQPRNYAAGTRAALHSLVLGPHHYLLYPDGREELFDVVNDPAEAHNLAQQPTHQALRAQLRQQLQTALNANR